MDFSVYLEAKADLDERSLNREVLNVFRKRLQGKSRVRILEAGCGTGAHLCRLGRVLSGRSGFETRPLLELTGLEREASLVGAAPRLCRRRLEAEGWSCREEGKGIVAVKDGQTLRFAFVCTDFWEFVPSSRWDAVCAHVFLDLVPVAKALSHIAPWLKPQGLLYASANYDGGTFLFPPEEGLEQALLARYDASMEKRRVAGEQCGGTKTARRLFSALHQAGWQILAYGSSDWNITPVEGRYRAADQIVLSALLEMMVSEGQGLEPTALEDWHRRRLVQLEHRELGLVIHQLDLLAVRP